MSTADYIRVRNIIQAGKYTSVHSCKKCPYITKSMFFIRNHIKRHKTADSLKLFDCAQNTPKIFICSKCNIKTYNTVIFKNHLKEHTFQVSERNSINLIKFSDKIKSGMVDDYKDDNKIVWPVCDLYANEVEHKTCPKRDIVYMDENNVKWYHCKDCSYKTKYKFYLRSHIVRKHTATEDIKWFHCDKCTFMAKLRCSLIQHIETKHIKNYRWFRCERCSYKTKIKSSLKRHTNRRHAPEDMWPTCSICSYRTRLARSLKKHMSSEHTTKDDIEWFQCAKCPFETTRGSYLKRHMMRKHVAAEDYEWFDSDNCTDKKKYKVALIGYVICDDTPLEDIK